jgi:hypothetical protein
MGTPPQPARAIARLVIHATLQSAAIPRGGGEPVGQPPVRRGERVIMWVIYLEAAGILLLVLFFVWWTMKDRK